jgi:beta-lactamase superfamily II metal-dependent hydrolase
MKKVHAEDIHTDSNKLEVFLFNVGQGDHIMLKFPKLEYGIIDFYYDTSDNLAEPPCLSYFKELKDKLPKSEFEKITISFFCISHTDKDHVRGITETIEWFDDNGIFIRDIWLGAARDKLQLNQFLREKINSMIEEFEIDERLNYDPNVNKFQKGIEIFFEYFEKWKLKEFKSKRYKTEQNIGQGEYLVEVRSLPRPCSQNNSRAVNMGPLSGQLDKYINELDLDIVKEILKIKNDKDKVEKNLLSHILRISFGEVNLLFGGDTHKKIWEECLAKYESQNNSFIQELGTFDSHFIKVSHHGSRTSSSPTIWKKIIPNSGRVYLGISAGRNKKYNHPHSETMSEIRACRSDSDILSTNICHSCLEATSFEKEYHIWYDNFIERNLNYGKATPNVNELEINEIFRKTTVYESKEKSKLQLGLLAFIIEVPDKLSKEIKVRVALSSINKSYDCFFNEHQEKLFNCCE